MSWWQLVGIGQENYRYAHEDDDEPVACPNDGEPLREGPDGYPFCPWDGWRPPGSPRIK